MALLPVHIVAGATAIIAGFAALFARKGDRLHRRTGMVFVFAMLTMAGSGTVMAALQPNRGNVMGGLLTFYMVSTAILTTRRTFDRIKWLDGAALLLGLLTSTAGLTFGLGAMRSATGTLDKYPAPLYFVFGGVAFLASLGDVRMFFQGVLGKRRIVRHLWRMCLSMFIATGSFFLGQAKVMPEAIRIVPMLAIPVLVVVILMFYWLVRVRFGRPRLVLGALSPVGRPALEFPH